MIGDMTIWLASTVIIGACVLGSIFLFWFLCLFGCKESSTTQKMCTINNEIMAYLFGIHKYSI